MFTARFIKRSLGADLWVKVGLGVCISKRSGFSEQMLVKTANFGIEKPTPLIG